MPGMTPLGKSPTKAAPKKNAINKAQVKKALARAKANKAKPATKPAAKPAAKVAGQPEAGSKVEQCIKLALRAKGTTPEELIALTGWDKAPWKWNFENPKGNGWAQRFGYKFKVVKAEDGSTHYHLSAK